VRNGTIVGWDKGLALHSEATVVGVRSCIASGNVFEIGIDHTTGPWANFCKGTGCPP
jgi:hypothetical protein